MTTFRDTQHCTHFYFADKTLAVTAAATEEIYFEDFSGKTPTQRLPDTYQSKSGVSCFEAYCYILCDRDTDRLRSLQSILGYLMNHNFDRDRKAVLFSGSSGSFHRITMITDALRYMKYRRCTHIIGNNFKDGKFYTLTEDTELVIIDTLPFGFDMSLLSRHMSDGAFDAKILLTSISTDQLRNIGDDSVRSRVIHIDFDNYSDLPPAHFSPDTWTPDERQLFYHFMIRCSQLYHQKGIILYHPQKKDKQ